VEAVRFESAAAPAPRTIRAKTRATLDPRTIEPDYARGGSRALGVGLPGLERLEATALVGAGIRRYAAFVRAGATQRLQAKEGLGRIGTVDRRMDHGPLPAAKVTAEKRVGLARRGADRKCEASERLERILSEEGVFDHAAGVRLDARPPQAAGKRIRFGHSEKLGKFYSDFPPESSPEFDAARRRARS
jgi:hypothetical protein